MRLSIEFENLTTVSPFLFHQGILHLTHHFAKRCIEYTISWRKNKSHKQARTFFVITSAWFQFLSQITSINEMTVNCAFRIALMVSCALHHKKSYIRILLHFYSKCHGCGICSKSFLKMNNERTMPLSCEMACIHTIIWYVTHVY